MPANPLPPEDLAHVLTHTRELWSEAKGADFFVTGGTGFFGMWLLESFAHINDSLGLGMRATVLTRNPAAFAAKAPHLATRSDLRFVAGDVRNFAFPAGTYPYVIHAATEASAALNEQAPHEMFDAIVGGTRRVLDFAAQAGPRKFLLTSSGAVYGRQPSDLTHVSEDYAGAPDPLAPSSAYGEGKRVAEHLCAVHARRHGYEVKVARCFAFVGPHLPLDTHFAIGNFLRDARAGRDIQIRGDGAPHRSYLYAADLAIWLWTLLLRGAAGRAYNVGSMADLTLGELAALTNRVTWNLGRVVIGAPASGGPAARYVPDTERAHRELGLAERIDLETALRRTFVWLGPVAGHGRGVTHLSSRP
jgi:nucleoside-diphosphate-sugar epimerase